jgi:hypothetical protein
MLVYGVRAARSACCGRIVPGAFCEFVEMHLHAKAGA